MIAQKMVSRWCQVLSEITAQMPQSSGGLVQEPLKTCQLSAKMGEAIIKAGATIGPFTACKGLTIPDSNRAEGVTTGRRPESGHVKIKKYQQILLQLPGTYGLSENDGMISVEVILHTGFDYL